jgi:hypothetical protein
VVAQSNLEPVTLLWFSLTLNFLKFIFSGIFFFQICKSLFWIQIFRGEKKMSSKNLRKFTVEKNHNRLSGSRFEWVTLIGAPSTT